ncbi:hypothetical protein CBL_00495 [Carabus blaptoides fortunei]
MLANIENEDEDEEEEIDENDVTLTPGADTDRITEFDLIERRRNLQHEKGIFLPQLCSTLAVSIGACVFGIIINWASAALYHMDSLEFSVYRKEADYTWLLCYGLIATTGYYALLLDAMRVFTTISKQPSLDFAIFGCVLYAAFLIATTINMRLTFGFTWYYNDGEYAKVCVILAYVPKFYCTIIHHIRYTII